MPDDETGTDHRNAPGRRRRFGGSIWFAAIIACAALVVGVMAVPRSPSPPSPSGPLVVAALPFFNLDNGTSTVVRNQQLVNEVSPWMYGIGENGRITHQYPPEKAAGVADNINQLRQAGVPIVPSLANITEGAWAYQPLARVLHDPALRQQHVSEIVDLVDREDYAGIDIDYENLRAADREAFSTFVAELADRLHEQRKTLSVALFAKTSDAGYDQRNAAQDYAAIGRSADEVRLMGYDYHWETSPPGPVAPIGWVRDVLGYAKSQIPPERIVLGVPLSGYDWSNGHGQSVSWLQAFRLVDQYHAKPQYDAATQSPWFRYTDDKGVEHEVWFENSVSSKAKFEAARGAGIRGVYLWMYGYEDTGTWNQLRQSLPPK